MRKHLSGLKGGQLARAAAPATVINLMLSDVVGDRLDVIASGPMSPDGSTFGEARGVLEARGLWGRVPDAIREHLEAGERGSSRRRQRRGTRCSSAASTW